MEILRAQDLTMSSREIADLLGARHDSVMRTIERLADRAVITLPPMVEVSSTGPGPKTIGMFMLDKRSSLIVVAQLCPEVTARVVDRWQELEAAQAIPAPMSQLEILAQSAQALLLIDRQQKALADQVASTRESIERIDTQLEQVAANRVWDRCPQNCEPITKIRMRINAAYGIPPWVIDMVMRQLPLSPKVHAMIRNSHEGANGSQYEVWAVADVTRVFARFVRECTRVTPAFATHPDIRERFRVSASVEIPAVAA